MNTITNIIELENWLREHGGRLKMRLRNCDGERLYEVTLRRRGGVKVTGRSPSLCVAVNVTLGRYEHGKDGVK